MKMCSNNHTSPLFLIKTHPLAAIRMYHLLCTLSLFEDDLAVDSSSIDVIQLDFFFYKLPVPLRFSLLTLPWVRREQ